MTNETRLKIKAFLMNKRVITLAAILTIFMIVMLLNSFTVKTIDNNDIETIVKVRPTESIQNLDTSIPSTGNPLMDVIEYTLNTLFSVMPLFILPMFLFVGLQVAAILLRN